MKQEYSIYDPRYYRNHKAMSVEEWMDKLEGRYEDTYDKPVPLKQMENVQPYKTNHQYEKMMTSIIIESVSGYVSVRKVAKRHRVNVDMFRLYLNQWCDFHEYKVFVKPGSGTKVIKRGVEG